MNLAALAEARPEMREVLAVRDVNVRLGGRPVLHGVSLGVRAGEILGLIGPNGAGKTTLMRAIMGLVPVESGAVWLESGTGGRRGHSLGYVPQRQDVDWAYPISVETMVMTGFAGRLGLRRRPTKTHWVSVFEALDAVGLRHLRTRHIGELSGGQKQRVLIARALATHPDVLLLDEPFTGLDQPNQDALGGLFRGIADSGVAIVMSTHDLLQAVDLCDRFVMLNQKVHAIGAPRDLLEPELWMETFEVGLTSPLLRMLGAIER